MHQLNMAPLNLKRHLSTIKTSIFEFKPLRRRAIFHLKAHYYNELENWLDLGWGIRCPFYSPESSCSFSEIFFEGEYEPLLAIIDLPGRWIDLGCHYGFFTLYFAWLRAKKGLAQPFHALLVDADERVLPGVNILVNGNHWQQQIKVMHGAIAEGSGCVSFHEQAFMSSVLDGLGVEEPSSQRKSVPIIDQQTILSTLDPPYDLVKIDIEGGEYDFLLHYDQVLEQAKHLVLEWHSWHRGGGSSEQIRALAESKGFQLRKVVLHPTECSGSLQGQRVGVFLFSRADVIDV